MPLMHFLLPLFLMPVSVSSCLFFVTVLTGRRPMFTSPIRREIGEGAAESSRQLLLRDFPCWQQPVMRREKVPMIHSRGRKGSACNQSTGLCCQEGKGTGPERELKLGSECAASPCEEPAPLVPAAVSHPLPQTTE